MPATAVPRHEVPVDRCPGLVRPYASNDGSIVRLRTGGVAVDLDILGEIVALAREYGDGTVQLTSRGALQIRALPDPLPGELTDRVAATGIIPAPSHELVRNIIASPLNGFDTRGKADIRPLVAAYDEILRSRPATSALPGRFLVAFDDGRGDVLAEQFDLAYRAIDPTRGIVHAGDRFHGREVAAADAPGVMVDLAEAFLDARAGLDPSPWHIRELPTPLLDPIDEIPAVVSAPAGADREPSARLPLGAVGRHLVVGVPLGLLTCAQFEALTEAARHTGARHVVVTPWRSIVVPEGADHRETFAAADLAVDQDSPWARLAACTGAPGCARAELDTRTFTRRLADHLDGTGPLVYISACERRCGAPAEDYVDLLRPGTVEEALARPGVVRHG
ncbi:precorrin-3B synthase [Austwickia chelonae]|uniref:Precorrin-3B synthase n=1 Tax=Austwickia chelonae NBRC 105200 TaxID=1184607 RepID=K6VMB3_9MICO|nr:precorrin-3B synthase [Austwickia chelonae]GAB77889.1 precorrin-3B synthase [Austwickia chelonae NBRC 105200]SEV91589.1 precorrin-3B synthase [Austwickia chelonae]